MRSVTDVRTTTVLGSLLVTLSLATACADDEPETAQAEAESSMENAPAHINIGSFGPNLTTLVAEEQGFLEDQNITVEYIQVTGSGDQFGKLRDGEVDLILTATDNVLNYRLNESNELGTTLDVQAVAGTNRGRNLSLVARPEFETVEDLAAETLAVDSPDSGFAPVLYQMLRKHGLERDVDYQLVSADGNNERYDALLAGEFAATLLVGGQELLAEQHGMVILETVNDVFPSHLGGVVAGLESWLEPNRDAVERLIRAYQDANDWVHDPANREATIALVEQSDVSTEIAEKQYELEVTEGVGSIRDLAIDGDGIRDALELRQEIDGFDTPPDLDALAAPEAGLFDPSYQQGALQR